MRKSILTDEVLVKQYINGDENSLRILINRYQSKLFSYLLFLTRDKNVAEDVFQDVFVKVITTLKSGKYIEEGKFFQWVVRISRNLVIDYFRRNTKNPVVTDTAGNELLSYLKIPESNKEDEIIETEVQTALKKMINMLPHEQREVLILRHYSNMSFKEIADLTNVSINTALGRMRYALMNIKRMMIQYKVQLT